MKHYLPHGMRLRRSSSGKTYYYLKTESSKGEIGLGANLTEALALWREHQLALIRKDSHTLNVTGLLNLFASCEIPTREQRLRARLHLQTRTLTQFFKDMGDPALHEPLPNEHQYQRWRGPRYCFRAGGEIRLFIHVWGWASRRSLVGEDRCPWGSTSVQQAYEDALLRELGEVLVYYSAHGFSTPEAVPIRPPDIVPTQHPDVITTDTTHADKRDALPNLPDILTCSSDGELELLRRYSVRHLRQDGRPDLAAALHNLTLIQVRVALAYKSDPKDRTPVHLTLGTDRVAKLKELTRKRARRKCSPSSTKIPPRD
jgi:hypothetical protein